MASTNTTANYGLPQYIATDKPTYLGDFNSAMLSIDTAIKGVSDRGVANQSNIAQAQTNIEDHDSRLGTVEAETTVNTSDIATANQNIINLQSQTNTQGQQIATITQATNANTLVIGAGQLETDAQTIIPAINELNRNSELILYKDIPVKTTATSVSKLGYFGSNGDSTFGTLLNANIIGPSDFQGYVTLNPVNKTVYVWAASADTYTVRVTYKIE